MTDKQTNRQTNKQTDKLFGSIVYRNIGHSSEWQICVIELLLMYKYTLKYLIHEYRGDKSGIKNFDIVKLCTIFQSIYIVN